MYNETELKKYNFKFLEFFYTFSNKIPKNFSKQITKKIKIKNINFHNKVQRKITPFIYTPIILFSFFTYYKKKNVYVIFSLISSNFLNSCLYPICNFYQLKNYDIKIEDIFLAYYCKDSSKEILDNYFFNLKNFQKKFNKLENLEKNSFLRYKRLFEYLPTYFDFFTLYNDYLFLKYRDYNFFEDFKIYLTNPFQNDEEKKISILKSF